MSREQQHLLRAAWAILLLVTGILIAAAGCVPQNGKTAAGADDAGDDRSSAYVGNAVCAGCHEAQFRSHQESYHAKTLTLMTPGDLGTLAPPPGPVGKSGFSLRQVGDAFYWGVTDRPEKSRRLDLALGSGKTGVTYVSLRDATTVEEAHYTYFPHTGIWEITPGQESDPADSLFKPRSNEAARQCIACHSVTMEPTTLMPRKEFFGVGCEACHGPGGAHARAAKKGDFASARMEKLGSWSGSRINEMCGRCHVSFKQLNHQTAEAFETHRFTAYGLMKSECFLRSNDTLSCVTCHEPHRNARTDEKSYVDVCLSCHTSPSAPVAANHAAATQTHCPVNPRDGCVTCHMPKRRAFKDSRIQTRLTDHFIRVWMKGEESARR